MKRDFKVQTTNEYPSEIKSWKIITFIISLPLIFFTFLMLFNLIVNFSFSRFYFIIMPLLCFGGFSILCLWFAFRGHDPKSRAIIQWSIGSGFILGIFGFLGGFLGPMILSPESNQGPLLGILFTGPLGFIIGVIVGAFYTIRKYRKVSLDVE